MEKVTPAEQKAQAQTRQQAFFESLHRFAQDASH